MTMLLKCTRSHENDLFSFSTIEISFRQPGAVTDQFFITSCSTVIIEQWNLIILGCGCVSIYKSFTNSNKYTLTFIRSIVDWVVRYKIYHIPFWIVYHYFWWTIAVNSPSEAANTIFFSGYAIKYFFYVIFQAIGVYFNLYFLIPRFLEKGRYIEYTSSLIAVILITAVVIVPGYYISAWLSDKPVSEMYYFDARSYLYFFQVNTLPSTVASMTLAMSVKLTKNWIQSKRREQVLEKEKLETELKFLKSQFNPHFLFNTINSIFVLIRKDPNLATEALAKFSDILRYQLYECNEQQIPLDQELSYLQNFIELQKLRQDDDAVDFEIKNQITYTGNRTITPFILMPFVENAFKHVSRHNDKPNWIRITLWMESDVLNLTVSNSTSGLHNASDEFIHYSGIGLKNVKRRLDLVYPKNYNLSIERGDTAYHVTLKINLHTTKTPMSVLRESAA